MAIHSALKKAQTYRVYDAARQFGSKYGAPLHIEHEMQRSALNDQVQNKSLHVIGFDSADSVLLCRPSDIIDARVDDTVHVSLEYAVSFCAVSLEAKDAAEQLEWFNSRHPEYGCAEPDLDLIATAWGRAVEEFWNADRSGNQTERLDHHIRTLLAEHGVRPTRVLTDKNGYLHYGLNNDRVDAVWRFAIPLGMHREALPVYSGKDLDFETAYDKARFWFSELTNNNELSLIVEKIK